MASPDEDSIWNDDIAVATNYSLPVTGAGNPSDYWSWCDRDAITNYLHGSAGLGAGGGMSSLLALLADTRTAAKRDRETGRLPADAAGNSWLAAVGYCIALDQIGGVFTANPASANAPAFRRALDAFTDLNEDETSALYAMRCALVHDYSTINIDRNGKTRSLDHAFALNADPSAPLIKLPQERYDRERPHAIHPSNQTWVNIRALGDLVEQVVIELRARHERGELRLHVDRDDLARRFGLSFTTPESHPTSLG